jgi:hypothetical protein
LTVTLSIVAMPEGFFPLHSMESLDPYTLKSVILLMMCLPFDKVTCG